MVMLLLLCACQGKGDPLRYRAFSTTTGWGYEIALNDRIIIKQENIPVVNTNKGFDTREQAEGAARIVIAKLRKKELPSLTETDLQQLKVIR